MSTSRSRYRQTRPSRITDDQIADLIYKLQQLIPNDHRRKGSSAKVLEETCSYVRSLQREVEDLSQRLSELLQSMDTNSPQAAIIRTLLMSP
ncbi:putative transcription factor bHLH family [Helianthus annuus]|uniref:Putative myc-type, basic helix-loop-helix (BHLH) domain-containing protein n=1 Tax=Helianthus annuus TaxID=4232 RepID=A0A251V4N9_HELAN|nr:transcription factor ILI6 [Helianthus annuus]KAF5757781.1 putative transcription factor bHLH family [Helianthus annuus]KAJ0436227.1 putative transcription factor bHLH family [Helianthus annuus]KAJ0449555.1 putative transcription factor bHLH family [Helianthus annuus]KAJ0815455.1 putative transcription factor bHLH family [Helianthus annuus]KAJ0828796.1 putative transcription factor bHLH family [Helianthus annuus]